MVLFSRFEHHTCSEILYLLEFMNNVWKAACKEGVTVIKPSYSKRTDTSVSILLRECGR